MAMDDSMSFGGSGIWIFGLLILLALLLGGNGNGLFGGNRGSMFPPNVATTADVQRATDFAALERQNNEGVAATRQGVYDVAAAVKDGNYNILSELRDLESASDAGIAQQQVCCCETNRNIDSVRYDMSNFAAAIKENQTAGIQKVLDQLATNATAIWSVPITSRLPSSPSSRLSVEFQRLLPTPTSLHLRPALILTGATPLNPSTTSL